MHPDKDGCSAADCFWHPSSQNGYARVRWKNPMTGLWHGPDPVLIFVFFHRMKMARPGCLSILSVIMIWLLPGKVMRQVWTYVPDPPFLHPVAWEKKVMVTVNDTCLWGVLQHLLRQNQLIFLTKVLDKVYL